MRHAEQRILPRAPAIHVVAGVLIDRRGRVLIAQRPLGKPLAGAWEFPGGKLEPGEARTRGLARELEEELGLSIRSPRPLLRLRHRYAHAAVLLDVFVVRRYRGRLEPRDRQVLRWVTRAELARAPLLPADRPILDVLVLPERLRQRAARGYRVLSAAALRAARARRSGRAGRVGAGGSRGHLARAPLTGAPLTGAPLRGAGLVGALCRSPAEARAIRGADFLVLRERCADGELEALCRATPRPVYAAGVALERAWQLGASGVQSFVW